MISCEAARVPSTRERRTRKAAQHAEHPCCMVFSFGLPCRGREVFPAYFVPFEDT